jgi:hypothetical protein
MGGGGVIYPPNEQRAAESLTAESRAGRIWRLVARQAGSDGTRPTVAVACSAAMGVVDVSGAWVTAASLPGPNYVMCVTGQVSEQPAELQVTLGEGPRQDVADLVSGSQSRRWARGCRAGAGCCQA